jgi:hypothetical protein
MRNFELISLSKKLMILVGLVVMNGFTSCSRPIETVCNRDFPRFFEEVKAAEKRASGWANTEGRQLATQKSAELDDEERLAWKSWAENGLKGAARLMERAEDDAFPPDDVQKIHRLSNELVIFWGHVDKGKDRALARSLQAIERHGLAVQATFCYQKGNDKS